MILRTEEEGRRIQELIPIVRKIYQMVDEYIPEGWQEERSAKIDRAVESIVRQFDIRIPKFTMEYEAARERDGRHW